MIDFLDFTMRIGCLTLTPFTCVLNYYVPGDDAAKWKRYSFTDLNMSYLNVLRMLDIRCCKHFDKIEYIKEH